MFLLFFFCCCCCCCGCGGHCGCGPFLFAVLFPACQIFNLFFFKSSRLLNPKATLLMVFGSHCHLTSSPDFRKAPKAPLARTVSPFWLLPCLALPDLRCDCRPVRLLWERCRERMPMQRNKVYKILYTKTIFLIVPPPPHYTWWML